MPTETPVEIGQMLAGKYRVDRVLGQGGMGIVVAATHTQLEQKVAVKFLLPEATQHPEAVKRFLREARAAVKIQSEFVARVIDVGTLEETGTPYMVMEYLDGRDLEGVLAQNGPLPVEEAVEYVLQGCAALAEAHSHGIVHRDLKPANLFRTVRSDGAPVVKVLDFGISKLTLEPQGTADANLTGTAAVLGTPMYMSPEQIRSTRDVDSRTDVWALGSILHELLSGQQPFAGDSMPALFASILEAHPQPLRAARPDVPEALERVIHKCLQKNPDERFANVAALAAALRPFAPPRSQELAQRAARVLGVAEDEVASHINYAERASALPSSEMLRGSAADGIAGAQTAPAMAQTGVAWGTTQSSSSSTRALLIGAGVIALLAGGAGFFLMRGATASGGDEAQESAPSALGASSPAPAKQEPEVAPAEPVRDPMDAGEAPPSSSAAAPSAAAPPAAPKPLPVAAPAPVKRPPKPKVRPTVRQPTPEPAAAPAPKPAAKPPPPKPKPKKNPLSIDLK